MDADFLRVAFRGYLEPDGAFPSMGFRCAHELTPAEKGP
jgi:formylglycine-generating enzyme required for sulfatase activity